MYWNVDSSISDSSKSRADILFKITSVFWIHIAWKALWYNRWPFARWCKKRSKCNDGRIRLGLKISILVLAQLFTSCMTLVKDYGFSNLNFPICKKEIRRFCEASKTFLWGSAEKVMTLGTMWLKVLYSQKMALFYWKLLRIYFLIFSCGKDELFKWHLSFGFNYFSKPLLKE